MSKNQTKEPEELARLQSAEPKAKEQTLVYVGKDIPRLGLKTYTVYTSYNSIPEHVRAVLEQEQKYKALFVSTAVMHHAVADLKDKTSALYQINRLFK